MLNDIQVIEQPSVELSDELSHAKLNVSLATTMISFMMYRCNIKFMTSEVYKTAFATVRPTGNYVYINVDFWNSLENTKQRAFLIAHEVLHIFLDHVGRAKSAMRRGDIWNYATDYNINASLKGYTCDVEGNKHKETRFADYLEMPQVGLFDEKYIGMSSDEIYHLLMEEYGGESSDAVVGILGKGFGEDFGDSGEGAEGHEDSEVAKEKIQQQIMKNIQTATTAAITAQMGGHNPGSVEAGLARHIQQLSKPKIPWTDVLNTNITKNDMTYLTYNKYNRKSGEIVFPSYYGDEVHLVFGIDTSGSMSDKDITSALSELFGMMQTIENWTIHVISCDTAVYEISRYSSEEGDTFDSVDLSKLRGMGGTLMQPMIDYAEELNEGDERINTCLIFTDGYLSSDDTLHSDTVGVMALITPSGDTNFKREGIDVAYL